jgi:hypothetical protein
MSILSISNEPEVLTIEKKQERVSKRILNMTAQTYNQLVQTQKQGINMVWKNQQGLTPQQVCDSLGENASKVFDFHGILTEVIATIATIDGVEPDISLPTNAFTRNEDGTITVSDQPYEG